MRARDTRWKYAIWRKGLSLDRANGVGMERVRLPVKEREV